MRKGKLIVLSGPSGVGKETLRRNLNFKNYVFSISSTTRNPRNSESDGVEYHFITKEEFETKIANNEMLEYATFCDNYYGTEKSKVLDVLDSGTNVLLEIECQGALQVIAQFPEAVSIFILPPSLEELEKRLINRNTETTDVIQMRLEKAKEEIQLQTKYKFSIINSDLETATKELDALLERETND